MMGLVIETRQGMFNWLKEKLPNTPEYVIRDWVYKMIKQSDDVNTYEGITEWIDEWVKDIEWEYQKDFPISMDIFTDKTKKELESRIQGEVRQDVDNILKKGIKNTLPDAIYKAYQVQDILKRGKKG